MSTNLYKPLLKTVVVFVFVFIAMAASAQRYNRNYRNFPPPPPVYRSYGYIPVRRPVIVARPAVSINIGIGSRYARSYYSRPYNVYGPSVGFHINTLPFGCYPFSFGSSRYYYYDNTFYRRYNDNEYEVIAPPMGAKIPSLPRNAKAVLIDGQKYYELGGTYYVETFNQNNQLLYEVVGKDGVLNTGNDVVASNNNNTFQQPFSNEPRLNDVVSQLPDQCKTVTVNGQTLYVSPDNIYYQQINDGDNVAYKVVGK